MTLLRVRPLRVGTVVRVGLVVALIGCTAAQPGNHRSVPGESH